jgi:hypothetical protein
MVHSPRIYNKHHRNAPPDAAYVGRPSKFGNPFEVGPDGSREEVIEKFTKYIRRNPSLMLDAINELSGKDLVCWCAPLPCHADVLLRLVNNRSED